MSSNRQSRVCVPLWRLAIRDSKRVRSKLRQAQGGAVRQSKRDFDRNGITLLFVISMIVLFLLMGTAFVIVANNFYKTSKRRGARDLHKVEQKAILETAFYDLLRGTDLNVTNSPLRGHSILGDMYGYGFTASLSSATVDTSEHFLKVQLNDDGRRLINQTSYTPSPIPGSMTGRVMSFVSGPARGLSTRIVDHQVTGDSSSGFRHDFVLLPHWTGTGLDPSVLARVGSDRVVVNGRPFAGSGAGYLNSTDPYQPALSESALQPNQTGRSRHELLGAVGNINEAYFANAGGPNSLAPNEPYDTFDAQNMFLAGIKPNGEVIPSFHRQVLIDKDPADPRKDFRADSAAASKAHKGVVVDNDNDGRDDGIWMDIGLPVVSTADGQNIKPLVSFLVLDMESRVNVNAHGSLVRQDPNGQTYINLLGGLNASSLPKGQGFGPADIGLDSVLPSSATRIMRARYGADGAPGIKDKRDDWSNYQLFGLPTGSFNDFVPGTVGGHYGSLLDLHGRFSSGYPQIFDWVAQLEGGEQVPIGMPVFNVGLSRLPFESVDSPYEFSMSNDLFYGPRNYGSDDRPFTAREFEAFLRPNDSDTPTMPLRMRDTVANDAKRNSVSAFGYEVPATFENLAGRLYSILNGGIAGNGAAKENKIRSALKAMLPAELQRGLPMNVNRSFGDGEDNNGNGVIDEPGENNFLAHPSDPNTDIGLDLDNDATVTNDPDANGYRNAFMKQLYVLTLLVTERKRGAALDIENEWFDFNLDGNYNNEDLIEYRKRIAQWVVNIVDFRDPDSIMTPFECDLDPWNGWDMDGLAGTVEPTDRFLVWGAERPELLITETFASHDTRLLDLDSETVDSGSPGFVTSGDDSDLDSLLAPKVTALFELYNPWVANDANQIRPAEVYDNGRNGVDLQKTAVDGSPVWRLVVSKTDEKELDPDLPGSTQEFDRRIYFSRPPQHVDRGRAVFFPSGNIQSDPIAPGMYGVVGTGGQEVDGKYHNYFGRRTQGTAQSPDNPLSAENLANATRRISMDPVNQSIEVLSAKALNAPGPNGERVEWISSTQQTPVLPIDRSDTGYIRELGVSDPVNGYYNIPDPNSSYQIKIEPVPDGIKFVESDSTGSPVDFTYDSPVDELADREHYNDFLRDRSGTVAGYRVVHLQRLANPLSRWNERSNPYRTVDSAAIDLFVFNGVEPTAYDPSEFVLFSSLERRKAANVDTQQVTENRHRQLFSSDIEGNTNADSEANSDANKDQKFNQTDNHFLTWNLTQTLGRINTAYREAGQTDQQPYSALAWHNRPFISQFELAEVPFLSSSQLTRRFGNADRSRDVYSPGDDEANGFDLLSGQFPHLLSLYADRVTGETAGPSLHRLMDFTEVPSRFLGTESFVNPTEFINDDHGMSFGLAPPFDRISSYRYPGKINANTVLDPSVWEAVCNQYAGNGLGDGVTFSQWEDSRKGDGINSDFDNPLRPAYAFNFVGPDGLAAGQEPSDCGLFRKDGTSPPLFDYAPAVANKLRALDVDRASQFRFALRERLGNLVTNRSSVFAIWITTGFFEASADGTLSMTSGSIKEYGSDSGDAKRGRAFYLVDRSIPVAFEPGKNHNVDRSVLIKSFIEYSDLSAQP